MRLSLTTIFPLMKKLVILPFLLFATYLTAQVKIGIVGGVLQNSADYRISNVKQEVSNKYGFLLGATAKVPFEGIFFFSPSAQYTLKGFKASFDRISRIPDSAAIANNVTLHTLELAPLFQFDFSKKPSHFFIKTGPYLDIYLLAKEKFTKGSGEQVSRNMPFSFTEYGRFGGGLQIMLGYEMKNNFFIQGLFNYGLGSMVNSDYGPGIRNRNFGLLLGKFL